MQISTLSKDYLVDTIILHDVMGLLRPIFANPGICKVVLLMFMLCSLLLLFIYSAFVK